MSSSLPSFPLLKPEDRDREYKRYPEKLRDVVVIEYLINGKSNRWIDKQILKEDLNYSRGWFSMGVLHHLGLRGAHKGFFKGGSIENAVEYLSTLDEVKYHSLIVVLKRYSQCLYDLYNEDSLDLFIPPEGSKKLLKQVGKSQYTDGVRIDQEFHDVFNPSNSAEYVARGKARKIKVLFNNKMFDAEYRYEGQIDKTKELQSIRFKKELKNEFERVFPTPEGEFTIEQGIDLNHFVFSHSSVTIMDTTDDDEENEYSEGKEYYRLHRIRERKPEVVKKAKQAFIKKHGRLFCEACKFDFTKTYGTRGKNFIEGHHKKLISEMKESETTKVEDIAMLCSNCHRMIHREPLISIEQLTMLIEKIGGKNVLY